MLTTPKAAEAEAGLSLPGLAKANNSSHRVLLEPLANKFQSSAPLQDLRSLGISALDEVWDLRGN